jgi:alkylation response protein AidB-like acyl-CoA dehydrogenase
MMQVIYNEEMAYHRAPTQLGVGPDRVGPTIILYGTEEQKARHLPGIANAEDVWCQGFSEPAAGSDLAALQTRADLDGDHYVVNGQKIWTSLAHNADWCVLLARTDQAAPKHKGISYFLLDMKLPGIEVRPLVDMTGRHHFNELFFDAVKVPRENLLGELHEGWSIAVSALQNKRGILYVAGMQIVLKQAADRLLDEARRRGAGRDAVVRQELADARKEIHEALLAAGRCRGKQADSLSWPEG